MSSTNAVMLREMVTAFWAWINGSQHYLALGLQEFRLFDGKVLPAEEGGQVNVSAFPAHYTATASMETAERDVEERTPRDEFDLVLNNAVLYRATSNWTTPEFDPASFEALAAYMTITDVISTEEAFKTGLGSDAIDYPNYEAGEIFGVRDPQTQRVNAVGVEYIVRLRGTRRVPQEDR